MLFDLNEIKLLTGFILVFLTIVSTVSSLETERLTITPSLSQVVRYINDAYIVSCSGHKGTKVRWINPAGVVITKLKGRVHVEDRSNQQRGSYALVFTMMELTDKGTYTCAVEDGSVRQSFKLIVNEPISFMDTPVVQQVLENTDATIRCEVRGDPEPTVSWFFNGQPITFPHKNFTKLGDGLVINTVTREFSGEYTCRAYQVSETISNVQEQTIKLNVEHKPFVPTIASANIVFGFIDGVVNLTCIAEAEPAANFTWHKKDKKLSPKKNTIFEGQHTSVLQLTIFNYSAFGEYICKATNNLGKVENIISLQEHPKPERPSGFKLRGVNSDILDIEVGPCFNSEGETLTDITGYRFQIISSEDYDIQKTWKISKQIDFKYEDGATFFLTHLSPDTKYLVRVASRNVAGYSDWTDEQEFKTTPKKDTSGTTTNFNSNKFLLYYFLFTNICINLLLTTTINLNFSF